MMNRCPSSRRSTAAAAAAAALAVFPSGAVAYPRDQFSYNGLAQTPQMGWDNWNAFGCAVDHNLLTQQAQLIVNLGMRDLGYHYVVLDDCWSTGRNVTKNNTLLPDFTKFPKGIKAVADEMHSLGLKFGMYSSAGRYTCGMYEGSLGNEEIDAHTWASWGVDYIKYDNCYNEGQAGNALISRNRYKVMSDALLRTGRPILYAMCNWGENSPWNWATTIANSWRISGDVTDSWDRPDDRCPCDGENAFDCELPGFHCSILNIMNKAAFIPSKAQPGAWNDLDMLTVGIGGMTDSEYVSEFSIWSAVKSPLLTGNDFTKISPKSLSILMNAAVIAVNQDPLGSSAARKWHRKSTDDLDSWGRPATQQMWSGGLTSTTGGDYQDAVVVMVNGHSTPQLMEATLADIFIDSGTGGTAEQVGMGWELRDLWGYRMSEQEAAQLIAQAEGKGSGNGTAKYEGPSHFYNATARSYEDGLANREELLLGKVVGTVPPKGSITATVDAHGAVMYRLRALSTLRKKSEL